MSLPNYEYKGLMAQAWDLLRGDTSCWAGRFFYLDLIERYGQPALDVGCGTGRLLLDYLAQGIDIDGMDNSPEMLALCRLKGAAQGVTPSLYEQSMEVMSLPRTYRIILIPSSSLQMVIDPEAVSRAMDRLYAHLQPGGALAASFMTLWRNGDPLESSWEKSVVREDGAIMRRVASSRYDPATECDLTEDLYQVIVEGKVVAQEQHHCSPATRSYTQGQVQAIFSRAGFVDVAIFKEFTFEPAGADDNLFTAIGRKLGRGAG